LLSYLIGADSKALPSESEAVTLNIVRGVGATLKPFAVAMRREEIPRP
jgi:hypothetical protein